MKHTIVLGSLPHEKRSKPFMSKDAFQQNGEISLIWNNLGGNSVTKMFPLKLKIQCLWKDAQRH